MKKSLNVACFVPTATKSTPMNLITTQTDADTKYSPPHYKRGSYEVWDFIVDQELDYLAGNVVKYVCRAGFKNYESEMDDWLKVKAYVERKIKQLQENRNT